MRPIDLTARARIRDAAMQLYAQNGGTATTLRAVAQDAGVTAGLVSHHFRTKQGLRDACDEYVVDYLHEVLDEAVGEKRLADPAYLAATFQRGLIVMRYLSRALVDGSTAAAALFDQIVALTEHYLSGHPPLGAATQADTRAQATVLVTMRLGMWVLSEHLMRALGAEAMSTAVLTRVGLALSDIVSPEFAGSDLLTLAQTGLTRLGDSDTTAEEHDGH